MMGSFAREDEEHRFFDAQENLSSVSNFGPECPDPSSGADYGASSSFQYEIWTRRPNSVQERRRKFFRMMGLSLGDGLVEDESVEVNGDDVFKEEDNDRITERSGAVLRSPVIEDELSLSLSSLSSWSGRGSGSVESFVCRFGNLDGGLEGNEYELLEEGGRNRSVLPASELVPRELELSGRLARTLHKVKTRWLSRLRTFTCIVDPQSPNDILRADDLHGSRVQRVRVRQCRKRVKELSALFRGQDIQAHDGSILAMKFSLDGQYLASAGEDGVVRVWQVVEDERSNDVDIPDVDSSCIYFTVSKLSELEPFMVEKDKMNKMRNMRKTADSACVIFPPKVFRILEKPLHEFHGHTADILDLSWSKNNCLLSSSVDKTVRLWRVGCDECLEVFSHCNYVTCVQFNPVDDNIFVSGSIDGKVRIWAINGCQVVDWTDIRDIVTAVAYRPDGKGGIIGSMMGSCCFFSISDNHFQLESHLCLNNKKKTSFKRIIGFEFLPQDPTKVLVTCADQHVRIIHGVNVIGKYKGLRNAGNQISASFTSDGSHVVSACEDSHVYVWNCVNQEEPSIFQSKTISSFECFSADASIAIPWSGLKLPGNSENGSRSQTVGTNSPNPLCFSLGQEFFLESIPKGSATWPEEKLPASSPRAFKSSSLRKSHYKFLKACQNSSTSHVWGLVIVTAGWDGRIRSFHNYGLPVPC
ncbi:hypothetical protein LguiA_031766 [Lonicera macranthoides]